MVACGMGELRTLQYYNELMVYMILMFTRYLHMKMLHHSYNFVRSEALLNKCVLHKSKQIART